MAGNLKRIGRGWRGQGRRWMTRKQKETEMKKQWKHVMTVKD